MRCTRSISNGGASIFTFNIKGSRRKRTKFIDSLKIFSLLANVADVKSLVIHPATTTHSQLTDEELADQGIAQNTIRLSMDETETRADRGNTSRVRADCPAAASSPQFREAVRLSPAS